MKPVRPVQQRVGLVISRRIVQCLEPHAVNVREAIMAADTNDRVSHGAPTEVAAYTGNGAA